MTEQKQHLSRDIEQQTAALRLSDADLREESSTKTSGGCPYKNAMGTDETSSSCPFQFVPLRMGGNGGTHKPSTGSEMLIKEVPLEKLQEMTDRFYVNAFQDNTLDQFIHSHEDPHGARFAKWIHQKLSGSNAWDEDRATRDLSPRQVAGGRQAVVYDRSSAHAAAWYSAKRPRRDVGRHFQLDECRVWMRLHFWAMRESGLMEYSPSFADYYVRFIGHFVRVYESKAPLFARDSLRWSANPDNIQRYLDNGRVMTDVLGLKFEKALSQIPESESSDLEWPYNQSRDTEETQKW